MQPVSIFISYAHADERFRKGLATHLSVLERLKVVKAWHDRLIRPGMDWASEIDQAIGNADIVLCLVSADFIRSDYCWSKEMTVAMKRHQAGQCVVIPVLLRPVGGWDQTPLAALQALPSGANGLRPVSKFPDRDAAWTLVVEGILEVAQGMFGARARMASALDSVKDPGSVHPALADVVRLLRMPELIANHEPANLKFFDDLTLLHRLAPTCASAIEVHRRAVASHETWREKALRTFMETQDRGAFPQAIANVLLVIMAEKARREAHLKLLEADVLIACDIERAAKGGLLGTILVPKAYGFRHSLEELNVGLTKDMEEYAGYMQMAIESTKALLELASRIAKVVFPKEAPSRAGDEADDLN